MLEKAVFRGMDKILRSPFSLISFKFNSGNPLLKNITIAIIDMLLWLPGMVVNASGAEWENTTQEPDDAGTADELGMKAECTTETQSCAQNWQVPCVQL